MDKVIYFCCFVEIILEGKGNTILETTENNQILPVITHGNKARNMVLSEEISMKSQ